MIIDDTYRDTRQLLLNLASTKRLYIEGDLLKILEAAPDDEEFSAYLKECIRRDHSKRRKRLGVTTRVQQQNTLLEAAAEENRHLLKKLEMALNESKKAEAHAVEMQIQEANAKQKALDDLDVVQKKAQFKMMGIIVKVSLGIIVGVGIATTALYVFVIASGAESTIVETTWSNLFGILLTNSFSILGTIMGVRYVHRELGTGDE